MPWDRNNGDNARAGFTGKDNLVSFAAQGHRYALAKRNRIWKAIETFFDPIDNRAGGLRPNELRYDAGVQEPVHRSMFLPVSRLLSSSSFTPFSGEFRIKSTKVPLDLRRVRRA